MTSSFLKLCLVTHPNYLSFKNHDQFLLAAIKGGVTSVQLRAKKSTIPALRSQALALLALLRPLNIPLIINDHVELALEINADGVHLGQTDKSPSDARAMLGADKIIGWSVETLQQLEQANQWECLDYVAASCLFPSKVKQDCRTVWGLDGLKKIIQLSRHPVIAIGGINQENSHSVMQQGAAGIAVISALYDSAEPELAASQLRGL